MAKAWSAFYDWVLPQVPGCSTAVADQAIRDAAIDFYTRTGILVHQPGAIEITPGTATYALSAPSGYGAVRIEEMFLGDMRLKPVSNVELSQLYLNWTTVSGQPMYYLAETSDSFRLVPKPDANMTFDDDITVRAVVAPTRSATQIAEDWVFEDWGEVIAAGAVSLLMQMPQKPWTDLGRAVGYSDTFRRGIGTARANTDRGKVGAVQQVRLKRFI